MTRGSLNGSIVYTVGDFGPTSQPFPFAAQDAFNPPGRCYHGVGPLPLPLTRTAVMRAPGMRAHFCSEFYSGWLTHWGESMGNKSTTTLSTALDSLLGSGASVSMYMGIGGTNFEFWNGANGGGTTYQQTITSYDCTCSRAARCLASCWLVRQSHTMLRAGVSRIHRRRPTIGVGRPRLRVRRQGQVRSRARRLVQVRVDSATD